MAAVPAKIAEPRTAVVSPPSVTDKRLITVATSTSGGNWVAFADEDPCDAVDINNLTGVTVRWRYAADTSAYSLLGNGQATLIPCASPDEVEWQRDDVSNTQVTVRALALVY